MSARGKKIAVGLLPPAMLCLDAGWRIARPTLMRLYSSGVSRDDLLEAATMHSGVHALGMIAAGLAAARFGPRAVFALGAVGVALAVPLVWLFHAAAPAYVGSFAFGAALAACFGVAAQSFGAAQTASRDALVVCVWLASELAGFQGWVGYELFGYADEALLAVAAGLLALGAGWPLMVARLGRGADVEPESVGRGSLPLMLGLAFGLAWSLTSSGRATNFALFRAHDLASLVLAPTVSVLSGAVLLVGLLLRRASKRPTPALRLVGVGLLCASAALALLIYGTPDRPLEPGALAPNAAGVTLLSLGGMLAMPLLLSRLTAAAPRRWGTAVVAALLVPVTLGGLVQSLLGFSAIQGAALPRTVGVLVCLALGVGLLALAPRLQALLTPPPHGPAEF